MNSALIEREIALRIALASRILPGVSPQRLLQVLADAVGLPPTNYRLANLRINDLKNASNGALADIDNASLKQALAQLKHDVDNVIDEMLPELEAFAEDGMADSIRVACASNSQERLDGHFGSCRRFLIYQVSANDCRLIDIRRATDRAGVDEKNAYRSGLIEDCQILFVVSIGGPAAAKVVRAGVHPIKMPQGGDARTAVLELQSVLGAAPPPWLAKVMGRTPEDRVRFTTETQA